MFELAWQFGCTVEHLSQTMSSTEFTYWRALMRVRAMEQSESRSKNAGPGGGGFG